MYIFVGLLYSEKRRKQMIRDAKVALESAANTYQWGLLRGLANITDETVSIINSVPMGTYPKQSAVFREKFCLEQEDGVVIDNIGYVNLPIIKQNQRTKGLYKRLRNMIKHANEQVTVIAYSLYHPYLKALHRVKKKFPHVQYVLIVPDLPCEYGIESPYKLRRWINRKIGYQSLSFAEHADGYVFLTEPMNGVVNKKGKAYEIIEGIGTVLPTLDADQSTDAKKVMLYTGSLDKVFGIDKLIDAYLQLSRENTELWIAGAGDMQADIDTLSNRHTGIKYFGYCTKEQVLELQAKADVLVNPRSAKGEYVKYSFPSKTMEYLATGKPVAMNPLPGMPREYAEHVFLFEQETAQSMASTLNGIFNLSSEELLEKKKKQLAFIRNEKCGEAQARKIVTLKQDYFKVGS